MYMLQQQQKATIDSIQFDLRQQHKSFELRIFWKFIQKFAAFYLFLSWLSELIHECILCLIARARACVCELFFFYSHYKHANLDAIRYAK